MVAILEIGAFSEQLFFFVACPSRTDANLESRRWRRAMSVIVSLSSWCAFLPR
jgi:hypothetical protein